jgi:hypothetical protein
MSTVRTTTPILLLLALALAGPARAAEAPAAPMDPLATLSWLAGTWTGEVDGELAEEAWMAPRGGLMLGTHRDVRGGKAVGFEFLRIAAEGDRVVYYASPGGRPPVPFTRSESGDRRVVFANPEHDFPQRILYWLDEQGRLHARIEGPPDEAEQAMEWVWTRAPGP